MEQIKHRHVGVNGLSLHVTEIGNGELGVVVFLHGFPDIWYSWRHQMLAVAAAGYRAIAPDFRGYGLSERPKDIDNNAGWSDLVADLLGILDSLAIPKVFLVVKDFGAKPAFMFTLEYPSRVSGLVSLGVPFSPCQFTSTLLPEGFYVRRFREPGRAEADFSRFDVKTVVRNIYILFSGSDIPIAREDQEIMDMVDPNTALPIWFSDEDLAAYAALYEKSGFQFPLHMPYRASYDEMKMEDPKIKVPMLLIVGERDYFLKFPGIVDNIKSGMAKESVPDLKIEYIAEGSHFVQEQLPHQVNQLIISFMKKHA